MRYKPTATAGLSIAPPPPRFAAQGRVTSCHLAHTSGHATKQAICRGTLFERELAMKMELYIEVWTHRAYPAVLARSLKSYLPTPWATKSRQSLTPQFDIWCGVAD